jgi:hypothetical protein
MFLGELHWYGYVGLGYYEVIFLQENGSFEVEIWRHDGGEDAVNPATAIAVEDSIYNDEYKSVLLIAKQAVKLCEFEI